VDSNVGLWDIVEALRWVQAYIGSFGGDSSNVTLMGQGQGATAALMLSVSPIANQLFHKVVAMSGSILNVMPRECAEEQYMQLREALQTPNHMSLDPGHTADAILAAQKQCDGCKVGKWSGWTGELGWAHLAGRKMGDGHDPTQVYPASMPGCMENHTVGGHFACLPVIDGDLIPEHPLRLLEQGAAAHLKMLLGSNKESMAHIADVYEGGRAFESLNDPRDYEVGLPPFVMLGHKLFAPSEAGLIKFLDVDGDGDISLKELHAARRGKGKDRNAAEYAVRFNQERADQMRAELHAELKALQGDIPADLWAAELEGIIGAYGRHAEGMREQEIYNMIKSDLMAAQVFMVAQRQACHAPVWCYRFDGFEGCMSFHGWDVAPLFGNPMTGHCAGWTKSLFEARVDTDDSGMTGCHEPSRKMMFDALHRDMSNAVLSLAGVPGCGIEVALGGTAGTPGWQPFTQLGDVAMCFTYPEAQLLTTTAEEGNIATRARQEKLRKQKAKFGKFIMDEMSSDEEFQEPPPRTLAGIEALTILLDRQCAATGIY